MARYNVSLPEYVVELADRKAAELGISRSAFIATAIQHKVQYDDMLIGLPKMLEFLDDVRSGKLKSDHMSGDSGSSATDVAVPGGVGEA